MWLGCMVGSHLNSTQTAQLIELADGESDLDDSLLVSNESQLFTGGFTYHKTNGSVCLNDGHSIGLGMKRKREAEAEATS